MSKFSLTRRLAFPPRDLYGIARNVRDYPSFVPLCKGSRVWDERQDERGKAHFRAALDIAYPSLRLAETFVSDVVADPHGLSLATRAVSGPVKHLESRWLFVAAPGGSDVHFLIDYQMSSWALQIVMSNTFDYAMRKVLTAFEERAARLFGPHSLPAL